MGKKFVGSFKAELDKYRNEVQLLIREKWGLQGTGRVAGVYIIKYYKTPDELVERRDLLCSSKEAGNTSKRVSNEIVEILTRLLNDKFITKSDYKNVFFFLYKGWRCSVLTVMKRNQKTPLSATRLPLHDGSTDGLW